MRRGSPSQSMKASKLFFTPRRRMRPATSSAVAHNQKIAKWLNTKALEVLGIDRTTPDPIPGLSYLYRDADGNPIANTDDDDDEDDDEDDATAMEKALQEAQAEADAAEAEAKRKAEKMELLRKRAEEAMARRKKKKQ